MEPPWSGPPHNVGAGCVPRRIPRQLTQLSFEHHIPQCDPKRRQQLIETGHIRATCTPGLCLNGRILNQHFAKSGASTSLIPGTFAPPALLGGSVQAAATSTHNMLPRATPNGTSSSLRPGTLAPPALQGGRQHHIQGGLHIAACPPERLQNGANSPGTLTPPRA